MNLAVWAERNGVVWVTAWATDEQIPVDKVVVEVGTALNGNCRKFLVLLRDPTVTRIVVEHLDRCCGFGSEYVESCSCCARPWVDRGGFVRG